MVIRSKYLEKIKPFIDKKLIKVLIGVRRSGKTVLLAQIADLIKSGGVSDGNIFSVNFESLRFDGYKKDYKTLYNDVIEKSKAVNGRIYLFFDEIQELPEWERVINSFTVDIDCDIYITGSNSNLLSGELATYISGRYVHFDVYPFTLREAKEQVRLLRGGAAIDDGGLFADYLKYGGLPQRFIMESGAEADTYLRDVFNTIVLKDIIARYKIKDVDFLNKLLSFLLDNTGNTFSALSISKFLKSEGRTANVETILNYIQYIKNAMIINTAKRYDIKGKNLLKTNEKYYAVDTGLRNAHIGGENPDINKLYENAVYLEMLTRDYDITVGKIGESEVDFVCTKDHRRIYIQVAYLLASEKTVAREFGALEKINDNYPKIVLSGDKFDFSRNGIRHYNIVDFLLNDRV
jgi:predicted AAA+ superfamily ATPase